MRLGAACYFEVDITKIVTTILADARLMSNSSDHRLSGNESRIPSRTTHRLSKRAVIAAVNPQIS